MFKKTNDPSKKKRKKEIHSRIFGYKASLVGSYGKSNRSLVITGAVEIVRYITNKIIIDMNDFYLNVTGNELKCITYTGGAVEIKGEIKKITLSDLNESDDDAL